jgi:hypothetical protein
VGAPNRTHHQVGTRPRKLWSSTPRGPAPVESQTLDEWIIRSMPPPTPTPVPAPPPNPPFVVDLPVDGGHTVVVHQPSDFLDQLYPHESPPKWAEITTGLGTAALAATAPVAALFTLYQINQARNTPERRGV